jgi:hypothetical protein
MLALQNFMAPVILIRNSLPSDVAAMKNNLRTGDVQEVMSFGISPERALWQSYRKSMIRKTVLIDGQPAAMFGMAGVTMGETGVPFLLTTPLVEKVSPLRFARIFQEEVLKMLEVFPRLVNYVDSSYDKATRLLDIVGFTLSEPEPYGVQGVKFQRFEMRRK